MLASNSKLFYKNCRDFRKALTANVLGALCLAVRGAAARAVDVAPAHGAVDKLGAVAVAAVVGRAGSFASRWIHARAAFKDRRRSLVLMRRFHAQTANAFC